MEKVAVARNSSDGSFPGTYIWYIHICVHILKQVVLWLPRVVVSSVTTLAISSSVSNGLPHPLDRGTHCQVRRRRRRHQSQARNLSISWLVRKTPLPPCPALVYSIMTFLVTKPPDLVVQAKVKKVVVVKETTVFCDSFWAYMLDDYLEDFSDDGSRLESKQRVLPGKPSRNLHQSKRSEKRRQKKRPDVVIEDIPEEEELLDDPLAAELDDLLSDEQQVDEQREQEAPELPIAHEDLDIIRRNSGIMTSMSRGRELEPAEEESIPVDIDKKMSKSTDQDMGTVSRADSSTSTTMHYSPSSEEQQGSKMDGRSRRSRGERRLAIESSEKRSQRRRSGKSGDEVAGSNSWFGLKARGSRDQSVDLASKHHQGRHDKDGSNQEREVGWIAQDSKRAEQEYGRRRIDRKEALQRIRAIKARLQTTDS